ncbi:DUF4440 domain-containing protein [Pseudomonas sp. NPDC089396]|uniref:DUF4440 domain-containing protein n=1 Tax=Pseudomonas sp. NPDC089396 TaxID=3364461 RepID=UPI003837F8DD
MHSNKLDQARRSVHHIHELIHSIFTSPTEQASAAITALMPVFADTFTMVSTAGAVLSRKQIEQMFKRVQGTRPGLEIILSDIEPLQQEGDRVVLRYKEVHRLLGVETARLSVVLLEVMTAGARWHYLQETAVSQDLAQ